MTRVVEYVGPEGVRTCELDGLRIKRPKPGDFIRWPNERIGRVEYLFDPDRPRAFVDKPGDVHCCTGVGSAFLGWDEERRMPGVSISGGPFMTVHTDDLEFVSLHLGRFWNWGDRSPGANQGCEYHLARPLFRYIGTSTHYSIRGEAPTH